MVNIFGQLKAPFLSLATTSTALIFSFEATIAIAQLIAVFFTIIGAILTIILSAIKIHKAIHEKK